MIEAAIPVASSFDHIDDNLPIIHTPVVATILVEYNFIGPAKAPPPSIDEWE